MPNCFLALKPWLFLQFSDAIWTTSLSFFGRVMVVGSSGVGKSSLVHHFLSPDYVYTYESTRASVPEPSVCIMLEDRETELVFLDMNPEEAQVCIETWNSWEQPFCSRQDEEGGWERWPECDCVLVVFSVTDSATLREAEALLQSLWQSGHLNTKAVIVVGNKIDLVRNREVPIDGERTLINVKRKSCQSKTVKRLVALLRPTTANTWRWARGWTTTWTNFWWTSCQSFAPFFAPLSLSTFVILIKMTPRSALWSRSGWKWTTAAGRQKQFPPNTASWPTGRNFRICYFYTSTVIPINVQHLFSQRCKKR